MCFDPWFTLRVVGRQWEWISYESVAGFQPFPLTTNIENWMLFSVDCTSLPTVFLLSRINESNGANIFHRAMAMNPLAPTSTGNRLEYTVHFLSPIYLFTFCLSWDRHYLIFRRFQHWTWWPFDHWPRWVFPSVYN